MPARIGLWAPQHKYPYSARAEKAMRSWLAKYNERSKDMATTRYLKTLGPASMHPTVNSVVQINDRQTRALEPTLPLA